MLSNDQLSRLTQLKEDLRANRDFASGIVRATSGRFGFVTLDDGREVFLNPEQMNHVFPGDRIEIEVIKNKKKQDEARLEKLLHSPVSYLAGRYKIRGKGHFIATDLPHFSRWIFIPPKCRANRVANDYITAVLTRHPFDDGRAQAKITHYIGSDNTLSIERGYAIARHQLDNDFSTELTNAANALMKQAPASIEHHEGNSRQDLRHIPFVTIDSAATKDMDDALAIEEIDNGWRLSVAIADPGTDIPLNSPLDNMARKRAKTTYFCDKPLPMLPSILSVERYSLKCGEERQSLVFQCDITCDGAISAFAFIPAIIKSHGKLSYANVAALLEQRSYKVFPRLTDPAEFKESLNMLQACSQSLYQYRQQHYIVTEHKTDFSLQLNEKGKLQSIEKIERNCAHAIVEEAMLVTNRCAGLFLARHQVGLYTRHRGYKQDRRPDIEALLTEKTGTDITDTHLLANYIKTVKTLQGNSAYAELLQAQQYFLEPSQISNQPEPHFGLGFAYYATITSPIRRYQDLYNQRVIHQLLAEKLTDVLQPEQLTQLHHGIKGSRDASLFMMQWLISDYMRDKVGHIFSASVSLLHNQGVGVRLTDNGIEGFVPAKKPDKNKAKTTGDKVSFNNQRMELLWNGEPLSLNQPVSVELIAIDHEKKKLEFKFSQ